MPRTQVIKSYFEAACAIDVHNHLRQDGLGMENAITTHRWWFHMMHTLFGIIEVDAFKTFCYFNQHKSIPTHRDFVDQIVIMLLTNRKGGAPELSLHQVELRKSQRQFRNDEGDDDDDDSRSSDYVHKELLGNEKASFKEKSSWDCYKKNTI